jgi:hypothetical protein
MRFKGIAGSYRAECESDKVRFLNTFFPVLSKAESLRDFVIPAQPGSDAGQPPESRAFLIYLIFQNGCTPCVRGKFLFCRNNSGPAVKIPITDFYPVQNVRRRAPNDQNHPAADASGPPGVHAAQKVRPRTR